MTQDIFVSEFCIIDDIECCAKYINVADDDPFLKAMEEHFTYGNDDRASLFIGRLPFRSRHNYEFGEHQFFVSRIVNNGETHLITLTERDMIAITDLTYEKVTLTY